MPPQAVYHQAQWAAPPVAPAYPYAQPHFPYGMPAAPAWQQPLPPDAGPSGPSNTVDEIRASLREFREAVQDLADSRARRRYF